MPTIEGYDVQETLYDSAKSLVLRARRSADGAPVVLKILKNDYPSPVELRRYRQEYEITRSLGFERVIKALEQRRHGNTLLIVLEDFGGESLLALLGQRRFTTAELVDLAIEAVTALSGIHARQIIHKDLNPSNILVNAASGELKIIDFGIATRFARESQVLQSPAVLEGTLAYLSPEQTGRMNRGVDYRADYYSLGVTLYQLFTGRLPFASEDAMELVHSHIAREPQPAHEAEAGCPPAVSAIIAKLMAKAAEDRYQSARGILADLAAVRVALADGSSLADFTPGAEDRSERLRIPERLYGRDAELAAVLSTFRRVSAGPSELLLVSGYSGVGKSALIQEVYKPITRERGYFIAGKFDQLQRRVPFSALVVALRDLSRQLLTESEESLKIWRSRLTAALGPNGQVIVDVIPDVELIVGPQAPAPELGPAETMNRFNMVFSSFIRVLCGSGHPLALFLDDLQWADSATLSLLEVLVTDEETEGLLVIGAYRDNEVDALHPLTAQVAEIRKKGGRVGEITLQPLGIADVTRLTADALHRSAAEVEPLARLVHDKTHGNPFFVGQFFDTLVHEGLVALGAADGAGRREWRWDVARIEAAAITENVVDLLIGKLRRLPRATQEVIRTAACIGNRFDLTTLGLIQGSDAAQTYADLLAAAEEGLVVPTSGLQVLDPSEPMSPLVIQTYRFQHDRVQQAAYALFEDTAQTDAVHLRIGRRLLAAAPPERLQERLFEVVDHLDRGRALIVDPAERTRLAELNLSAGKKAMESTAYRAAQDYLLVAQEALPADAWESVYPLASDVYRHLAECEYLNGRFERSEELVNLILAHAYTDLERAEVYGTVAMHFTMRTMFTEAIDAGRRVFALAGIDLSLDNLQQTAGAQIQKAAMTLGARGDIASLVDAPVLQDPQLLLAQRAVRGLIIAAFLANQDLFPVVTALSVNMSLEHGNAPESALTYANFGLILGAFMGKYREGYALGALGLALCEKFHTAAPTATVHLVMGSELIPWVKHVRETLPVLENGYRAGMEVGDILWAGYLTMYKVAHEAFMGKNLGALLEGLPEILAATEKSKNQGAVNGMLAHLVTLAELAAVPADQVLYQGAPLDEARFQKICETHRATMAICFHHILGAQVAYLLGAPQKALALTRAVEGSLSYVINHVNLADHKLYQSLAITALYPAADAAQQATWTAELEQNQKQLAVWAESCPENFAHKHLLVSAEMARVAGDGAAAVDLYDRAIEAARDNEFIQDQALANELAGRFWLTRDKKERIAEMYLREARYAYELWGARAKVAALDASMPQLASHWNGAAALRTRGTLGTSTTLTASKELDFTSVLKASQAISGEIALPELLQKLVRIVLENAGAQRGVILLRREDGAFYVEAKGSADDAEVLVRLGTPLAESRDMSVAVVNYVVKTSRTLVLKNAAREGRFTADPYVVVAQPKSLLCTPIVHHGKVNAILYLENNLSEGAFTEERLEVLRVLGAQAAISIENATLYASLDAHNQTLEKRVEERTQESMRSRNQLVAQERMAWMGTLSMGIAHEIKNPLNFVNNFAEISADVAREIAVQLEGLKGKVVEDGTLEGFRELIQDVTGNLAKVRDYGRRADQVVESMKSIAASGSSDPRETDINGLVEEFAKLVHASRTAKSTAVPVEVLKEYDAALGRQTVVAQDLGRALTNILNNAYEAVADKQQRSPGAGSASTILIQTVSLERHFEIRVRDTGTGIAPKHLGSIFTPFFTTRPAGSGHIGLGLAVSHDIVTLEHQGTLSVDSAEGRYTQLTIRLPKGATAASIHPPPRAP